MNERNAYEAPELAVVALAVPDVVCLSDNDTGSIDDLLSGSSS